MPRLARFIRLAAAAYAPTAAGIVEPVRRTAWWIAAFNLVRTSDVDSLFRSSFIPSAAAERRVFAKP